MSRHSFAEFDAGVIVMIAGQLAGGAPRFEDPLGERGTSEVGGGARPVAAKTDQFAPARHQQLPMILFAGPTRTQHHRQISDSM